MITTWLITIATFLLGFYLGKGSLTKQTYTEIKKELEHKIYPHFKQQSGVVKRPDAARLNELHHPEIIEEKEAMRATLQKGIEPLTI